MWLARFVVRLVPNSVRCQLTEKPHDPTSLSRVSLTARLRVVYVEILRLGCLMSPNWGTLGRIDEILPTRSPPQHVLRSTRGRGQICFDYHLSTEHKLKHRIGTDEHWSQEHGCVKMKEETMLEVTVLCRKGQRELLLPTIHCRVDICT